MLQVIGFAQRTPAPPDSAPTPFAAPRPRTAGFATPAFDIRTAVQQLLSLARELLGSAARAKPNPASRPASVSARQHGAGHGHGHAHAHKPHPGGAASLISHAAAAAAGARFDAQGGVPITTLEPATVPRPPWLQELAPLAHAQAPALPDLVTSLHDILLSHRACVVVGKAGAGKSAVWKALVAATTGPQALTDPEALAHVFPELLLEAAQLRAAAGAGGAVVVDDDDDGVPGASGVNGPAQWLLQQLQGSSRWLARRQHDHANGQTGAAEAVATSPRWLVVDGPLGTAAADCLVGLLLAPSMADPPAGGAVASLSDSSHLVWEADSVAGASPALLAAVPVLHVGQGLWDDEAALLMAVNTVLAEQGMVRGAAGGLHVPGACPTPRVQRRCGTPCPTHPVCSSLPASARSTCLLKLEPLGRPLPPLSCSLAGRLLFPAAAC